MILGSTAYSLGSYLTTKEQKAHDRMTGPLKDFFDKNLLLHDIGDDCSLARLTFDVYNRYSNWNSTTGNLVLLTLLKSRVADTKGPINTIASIIDAGWGDQFFACATTSNPNYYTAETLVELISLFQQVTTRLSTPQTIAPYDRGGKIALLQLLDSKEQKPAPCQNLQALLDKLPHISVQEVRSEAMNYLGSLNANQRLLVQSYVLFFTKVETELTALDAFVKKSILASALVLTTNDTGARSTSFNDSDLAKLFIRIKNFYQLCGNEGLMHFFRPQLYRGITIENCCHLLSLAKYCYGNELKRPGLFAALKKLWDSEWSFDETRKYLEPLALAELTLKIVQISASLEKSQP